MKWTKPIKIAVASVTAAAVVGGGIFYFANRQPSKEVTVVPVSNVYTSYWGDSKTLDGYVTTGSLQEVHMTEGGFDKVAVKEGDTVRKGDTLVEYDNTQTELLLRGDQAKINLLKSQIAAFEKQITDDYTKIGTLKMALDNATKPETKPDTGTGEGGATTPAEPAPSKVKVEPVIDTLEKAYNNSATDTTLGSAAATPYRFACLRTVAAGEGVLPQTGSAVKATFWADLIGKGGHAVFDIYDDVNATQWLARITVAATNSNVPNTDWTVDSGLSYDKSGFVDGFTTAYKAYGTLTLTYPDDLIVKVPVGDATDPTTMTPEEIKAEIERLYDDIDSCNKQIDSSKRDLRQAQITYERNKLTQSAGKIIASIDGTVATVGDNSTPVGEVFLRVQGASSYAVTLYVNELMLGEVNVGTTVQLMCYESGTMAPAVITEVDPEPAVGYYSGGNANASTYQVTAEITDPGAEPRLGEWCQATLDGQPVDQPSDAIYLPLFLVREDDAGEYVMKADENNRLYKQYVSTGKSLWGSYVEIKSGIVMEDRVAFPYGNTVREGAPTVDADYFDGY